MIRQAFIKGQQQSLLIQITLEFKYIKQGIAGFENSAKNRKDNTVRN